MPVFLVRCGVVVVTALLGTAALGDATPDDFKAGDLTFAPWTRRSGVVTADDTLPPGRWSKFYSSHNTGDVMNAAVTAVPELNCVVTAGTPFNGTAQASVVKAMDADTGAVRWAFDAALSNGAAFAFVKKVRLPSSATPAVVIASTKGTVQLLSADSGALLSTTDLPTGLMSWAAYLKGGAATTAPVPPFQAHLTVPNSTAPAISVMVVLSADGTTAHFLKSGADATLSTAVSAQCEKGLVLAVVPRGGGRMVVHCRDRLIDADVTTGAARTLNVTVGAISTIEHTASAAEGAPVAGVSRTAALQEVFFAAFSPMADAVVVGTVDFTTLTLRERSTLHTASKTVRAIRVLARNVTHDPQPTAVLAVVQTDSDIVAVSPTATDSRPAWVTAWATTYSAMAQSGAFLQRRLHAPSSAPLDIGVLTAVPTASQSAVLAAIRLGTSFFVIDAVAKVVLWSEVLPTPTNGPAAATCYATERDVQVNPTFTSVSPGLGSLLVGCPDLFYVVRLSNMAEYSAASVASAYVIAGAVPSVSTQVAHLPPHPVMDAPMLLPRTTIVPHTNHLMSAHAEGLSYAIMTGAQAVVDGAVFTLTSDESARNMMVVTAVGAAGQDIWRRDGILNPKATLNSVLQPFGPYLLVATQGWALQVLNASSGAPVTSFTMPFECTGGLGGLFHGLGFDHFIAMDPDFARARASGIPSDPSLATAVVFSFGNCEYSLDRALALRLIVNGESSGAYAFRSQLATAVFATITPVGALTLYDMSNVSSPTRWWTSQPRILTISASGNGITATPAVRLQGNIVVVMTSVGISVLAASTGEVLWADLYLRRQFYTGSLAVHGNTIIATSVQGVVGYHAAPQPVDESVPPHSNGPDGVVRGSAPQQVRWRQFVAVSEDFVTAAARLSQYGRYVVTTGLWAAAVEPGTGALVWRTALPPPSQGPYPTINGVSNMVLVENIASVVSVGDMDTMWQIDEATGAVLQSTASGQSASLTVRTVMSGRAALEKVPSHGRDSTMCLVTWPIEIAGSRLLPLPPAPTPPPPTHVAISTDYQRPTYAPAARPPIPPLPVQLNVSPAPPMQWWVPLTGATPFAGVAPARGIAVHGWFDSDASVVAAFSLESPRSPLWQAPVAYCGFGNLGMEVLDAANVAIVTCAAYITAIDLADGKPLWTVHADLNTRAIGIAARSPIFGPGGSPNTSPIVIGTWETMESTAILRHGRALWNRIVANNRSWLHSRVRPARAYFRCESGAYVVINVANGSATVMDSLIAASAGRSTIASITANGSAVRFVDARSAGVIKSGPLEPSLGYGPDAALPAGIGLVATDESLGGPETLIQLAGDQQTILSYVFDNARHAFVSKWSVSIMTIMEVAGFARAPEASLQLLGLAQTSEEQQDQAVMGYLGCSYSAPMCTDVVLFRILLNSGSVITATNVSVPPSPANMAAMFAVFSPRAVDTAPTSPFRDQYLIQTHAFTTLVDIDTLTPVYVNTLDTYAYGFGSLVFDAAAHGPVFLSSAVTNNDGAVLGKWALSNQVRAFEAAHATVVTALDDGTGDLVLMWQWQGDDAAPPALTRHSVMGPNAGALKWKAHLPTSQRANRFISTVNDNSVVVFVPEGVFFYDLATGATSSVLLSTLQYHCPFDAGTSLWVVRLLDPVDSVESSADFTRPASKKALVVGSFGPCVFMFNSRRELVTYRIPFAANIVYHHSFAIYAPEGAAPAVTAAFAGTAERWSLPVDFLTPTPAGTAPPAVHYTTRAAAVKLWAANLDSVSDQTSTQAIESHTLFVSGAAGIYAVDMHTGALLWRFLVPGQSFDAYPFRVADGKVFLLATSPDEAGSLYVLDALALTPPERVLKTITVPPTFSDQSKPSLPPLIADRVLIVPSRLRLIGVDTATLDILWNTTKPAGPQSASHQWIAPVSAPRGSPLFGAFVSLPLRSAWVAAEIRDAATGLVLGKADPVGEKLSAAITTCTSPGSAQRCAVVFAVVPAPGKTAPPRTVVTELPATAAVPHALPAPGPAPTSPPVPPGFRFRDPTPHNLPSESFAPWPAPDVPFATPNNAMFRFASSGLVVSVNPIHGLLAVDERTGATVWTTPLNKTLRHTTCPLLVTMATGSAYAVVQFGCLATGGLLTVVSDVKTGTQLFETTRFDMENSHNDRIGATLRRTVCTVVQKKRTGPANTPEGALCMDLDTKAVAFHSCPGTAYVSDLRPNSGTAIVMTCAGEYAEAIVGTHLWKVDPVLDAAPIFAKVNRPDTLSPVLTAAALLYRHQHTNRTFVTVVDADSGRQTTWSFTDPQLTAAIGASTIVAVSALSPRYVGFETAHHTAVLDVAAREVAILRALPDGVVCTSGRGCSALLLLGDRKTVISANLVRGTVESYDVPSNTTKWASAALFSTPPEGVVPGAVVAATQFPVVGGVRAVAVCGDRMFLLNADTGAVLWKDARGTIVFAGARSLWTGAGALSYMPPTAIGTLAPATDILATKGKLIVLDGVNIYSLDTTKIGTGSLPPPPQSVKPSLSGPSTAFLFGGSDSSRFLIALVNGAYWVFDVEANMTALYAFDIPLDQAGHPQKAHLPWAAAAAAEHGGTAYLPGEFSGILAVTASFVGAAAKVTFALQFRQTGTAVSAALSIYSMAGPFGVAAPIGDGAAVFRCADLTQLWASPIPGNIRTSFPAVVTGDYVLYSVPGRLVYASVITGQTVWRADVIAQKQEQAPYVWNNVAFVSVTSFLDIAVLGFDLGFDKTRPANMRNTPMMTIHVPAASAANFIFANGLFVVPTMHGLFAYSLLTGEQLWHNTRLNQGSPTTVVNGTLFIYLGTSVHAVNLRTGNATLVFDLFGSMRSPLIPLPGTQSIAIRTGYDWVEAVHYIAAPPLPPASRGPNRGLPPVSYPAASPTSTPAPTLATGAVVPSVGCVSRVVGASEGFVACVDEQMHDAYRTVTWSAAGPVFRHCAAVADSLKLCGVKYLENMGLECPAGADHVKALYAAANATRAFGTCTADGAGAGQCATAAASAGLCDVMKGDIAVAGVPTLKHGQHLALGFSFPPMPAFAPAPLPPTTPAPSPSPATDVPATPTPKIPGRGLTTTYTLRYSVAATVPSAADLGLRISTYLGIDAVAVRVLDLKRTDAGEWIFFNVTSENAQQVAAGLAARSEAAVALALGAAQFGLYVPVAGATPAPPPSSPPPDKTDPVFIAVAAVVSAVFAAAVAGVVVFVVMRRRGEPSRVGNGSMAGGAMSQRELKSLQQDMIGASPYEEA